VQCSEVTWIWFFYGSYSVRRSLNSLPDTLTLSYSPLLSVHINHTQPYMHTNHSVVGFLLSCAYSLVEHLTNIVVELSAESRSANVCVGASVSESERACVSEREREGENLAFP
jgi:uncharacterized circularly permuted ATP-grasp superfamily protein